MTRWGLIAVVPSLAIGVALAQPQDAAPSCDSPSTVHIPIEVVTAPLGLRGETRAQYLDRRYGAGAWQAAAGGLVALSAGPESLQLRFPAQAAIRFERIDIVAEAQLDYLDAHGRRSMRTGHREIGSYPLAPDAASGNLTVPLDVMRESGALLVIVTLRRAPDFAAPEPHVSAAPVTRSGCERRIYVPDRASAIRLNRRPPSGG
jgi:hypothetical protein